MGGVCMIHSPCLAGGAAVAQLRAICSSSLERESTHHCSSTNKGCVLTVPGLPCPTSLCDHQRWVCTVSSNACHGVNSEWIFAPQLSLKVCETSILPPFWALLPKLRPPPHQCKVQAGCGSFQTSGKVHFWLCVLP